MPLKIDLETRSDVEINKAGVYVYAESPHTDVLIASYKIGDGPIQRWRRGEPCPAGIAAHVEAGGEIHAHNATFERLMWWTVLTPKYGWPRPRLEQFRCDAVTAAAMSLPRSLERLGLALDLNTKKDGKGKKLIRTHSLPQGWADGLPIWNEDPASMAEFHDYCDVDVLAEEEAARRLVPLSTEEQAVYALNERVNDRGVRLDVKSARAAVRLIEKAKKKLDVEMRLVTGGYVTACTQVGALAHWVEHQGVSLGTLGKDDIEELLDEVDDLPQRVRRALELRQEAAKTSVSKISNNNKGGMLERVSRDGRIRGVYLHHGAGQTGRFSSRGVQAHNMPRYRKVFEDAHPRPDILFDAIRSEDPAVLDLLYGPELGRPLHLVSDAIRGFLWAAPGHDLIDADYSSIEGRMAAWFSGETWKLDAYRALDRGEGHGIYELTAAGIFGVPVERVNKPQRQGGKVAELSMGYQGGVGALARMARANKVKLSTIYDPVWEAADSERREQAESRYEERLEKHDATAMSLGREGWIAGELIKVGWRLSHPGIVGAWSLLERASTDAVEQPGTAVSALGVRYIVAHGFLWCQLPSGRCLAYGAPRLEDVEAPWADKTLEKAKRETKRSVTVMGVDSQTERWVRYPIYGGSLFNNVVQGSARDILVNGMFKAEAAGYPIVLHTHDEIAAEVPHGFGSVEEFERVINELPAWADGLPLTADGWRGKRYRK